LKVVHVGAKWTARKVGKKEEVKNREGGSEKCVKGPEQRFPTKKLENVKHKG